MTSIDVGESLAPCKLIHVHVLLQQWFTHISGPCQEKWSGHKCWDCITWSSECAWKLVHSELTWLITSIIHGRCCTEKAHRDNCSMLKCTDLILENVKNQCTILFYFVHSQQIIVMNFGGMDLLQVNQLDCCNKTFNLMPKSDSSGWY